MEKSPEAPNMEEKEVSADAETVIDEEKQRAYEEAETVKIPEVKESPEAAALKDADTVESGSGMQEEDFEELESLGKQVEAMKKARHEAGEEKLLSMDEELFQVRMARADELGFGDLAGTTFEDYTKEEKRRMALEQEIDSAPWYARWLMGAKKAEWRELQSRKERFDVLFADESDPEQNGDDGEGGTGTMGRDTRSRQAQRRATVDRQAGSGGKGSMTA